MGVEQTISSTPQVSGATSLPTKLQVYFVSLSRLFNSYWIFIRPYKKITLNPRIFFNTLDQTAISGSGLVIKNIFKKEQTRPNCYLRWRFGINMKPPSQVAI